MTKHVFPIFLDGDVQTVGASDSWNGTTSRINITGNITLTPPSNVVVDPGTIVSIKNSSTTAARTVTMSPDPYSDANLDVEAVAAKSIVTVMYVSKDIGWIPIGEVTLS